MSEVSVSAAPRRARRVAGRPARRWLVDVALIVIGVTSVVFEPISIAIHSIVGLIGIATWHAWTRCRVLVRWGRRRADRQRPALARPRLARRSGGPGRSRFPR